MIIIRIMSYFFSFKSTVVRIMESATGVLTCVLGS